MTETPSQVSAHGADRVELDGRLGPIAALRIRRPDAPIVLLVPGYTGSKEDFAPLLDPVAADGFEVVAIDLPGQNESVGPAAESEYLPGPLGLVLAELIGKLGADGRPVLLLGHSYGGLVSRAAVLAGASITGLTLLDSGPGELPSGARRQLLDLAEPALRQYGIEALYQGMEAMSAQTPAWASKSDKLKAFLKERFLRNEPAGLLGMAHGLRSEPDQVGALAHALRTQGTPCLVACGQDDDAWPVPLQRDMADRLDADFAVIPDALHSPNTENPTALLATLLPTWHSWL
ncbi:alpha/beta fold hydrolase [Labedaea rhizosphaerae]|uniref:Pimeloyl-ACP methyl ester carboxylesterase n=1 Tax=Labedaea rhizosphaerae TaxID=598644 RepID=A0A4R6S547_LABRH|nr:alpha/beta hydrolase [Labedaea rhizosphaerae]TDP93865.1 pimeloyl-ACP methyl ester carboxylesterase [Labedaea rhizosphaerae]